MPETPHPESAPAAGAEEPVFDRERGIDAAIMRAGLEASAELREVLGDLHDEGYAAGCDDTERRLANRASSALSPQDERALRAGRHLMERARSCGWPDNDEGAAEFWSRRSYETGWEDRGRRTPAPPAEAQGLRAVADELGRRAVALNADRLEAARLEDREDHARIYNRQRTYLEAAELVRSFLSAPPRDAEAGGGVRTEPAEPVSDASPARVAGAGLEQRPEAPLSAVRASTPPPGPAVEDTDAAMWTVHVALGWPLSRVAAAFGTDRQRASESVTRAEAAQGPRLDDQLGTYGRTTRSASAVEDAAGELRYVPSIGRHVRSAPSAGVPADQSGDATDMVPEATFSSFVPAGYAVQPVPADGAKGGLTELKLRMGDGKVWEVSYPDSSEWAKSWHTDGISGEQDWELVERYGLTSLFAAYDAARLSTSPAQDTPSAGGGEHITCPYCNGAPAQCELCGGSGQLFTVSTPTRARSAEPGARVEGES